MELVVYAHMLKPNDAANQQMLNAYRVVHAQARPGALRGGAGLRGTLPIPEGSDVAMAPAPTAPMRGSGGGQ